jgi:hypothetical protein
MTVILFLRRCVNQARISRGILRLELADAFEVSCVCDDAREFLELIELIQLRLSFFFTAINSAHRLWPSEPPLAFKLPLTEHEKTDLIDYLKSIWRASARQFLVAPTESYLSGRGADFEQVLVSTVSR